MSAATVQGSVFVATTLESERALITAWASRADVSVTAEWAPQTSPSGPAVAVVSAASPIEGCSVCAAARSRGAAPILILERGPGWTVQQIVDTGAADFVRRPYEAEDLLARLARALQQAAASEGDGVRSLGPLVLDTRRAELRVRGKVVPLRRAEYNLFHYLFHAAPRPVSREEIVKRVLDTHGSGGSARNQIYELRRKLDAAGVRRSIETHGAGGWRLAPDLTQI